METTTNQIEIPLEFRVACLLNHVGMEEVLQAFVDHVSIYCLLGGGPLNGYSDATATLSAFNALKVEGPEKPKTSSDPREINSQMAAKAVKQLITLGMDKLKTERKKHKSSTKLVDMLHRSVKQYTVCPEHLFLDIDIKIVFPKQFRLLCEIFSTDAEELIRYFMDNISLSVLQAHVSLNVQLDNPPIFFLSYLIDTNYLKHGTIPLTDAMMAYIEDFQQLDAKFFMVRKLDQRIDCYREFHLAHYHHLLNEKK